MCLILLFTPISQATNLKSLSPSPTNIRQPVLNQTPFRETSFNRAKYSLTRRHYSPHRLSNSRLISPPDGGVARELFAVHCIILDVTARVCEMAARARTVELYGGYLSALCSCCNSFENKRLQQEMRLDATNGKFGYAPPPTHYTPPPSSPPPTPHLVDDFAYLNLIQQMQSIGFLNR